MASDFLWWRDGVIYQIYPRSYMDSNSDGIGDIPGITSRLDHLQDLGIDAIWLSAVYPSPNVDFGYDVSDYRGIHPQFGTLKDFDRLVLEARRRGIHIIMDLVLNHSSDQHAWFQKSRQSAPNKYSDYYLWQLPKRGNKPPNNWLSVFGGPGWEFDEQRGEYYFHMFYKQQPDLNWRNPRVRQEILDIFRFWADRGVDGFRLDVFNAYFKDKDFRDNPITPWGIRPFDRMRHLYDMDQPELFEFIRELRSLLDAYPQSYVIGETFLGDQNTAAAYCAPGLLHAAFNFQFISRIWKAHFYRKRELSWQAALHDHAWPALVLNNHDNPRSATRFGQGEDDARLKVAAAMLLSLRGTPFLYAGEEIGMRDIKVRREEVHDPIGKYYWPFFKGRDGCRSPMQWDGSKNAGFTTGNPWLRLHENYTKRNVGAQLAEHGSLLNFYKKMLALRRAVPALHAGSLEMLNGLDQRVLGYSRQAGTSRVLVLLNFSSREVNLTLSGFEGQASILLSSAERVGSVDLSPRLQMSGNEALILELPSTKQNNA